MVDIKNILLIGRTGSGKSTLANVLTGTNNFVESAKSISVTKNIEEGVVEIDLKEDGSEKTRYRVIDTIGIGDTKLTPQGVLTKLAEMAGRVKKEGLNQILFVTRGRFSKEEIEAYDLLSSIIFDSEVIKYTTIVRVGFPEFEEQEVCDEDRWALREENPKLAHILNSIKKILYLDNPPIKGRNAETNKEIREESRKRLLTHLAGCQGNYHPSNIDTLDERVQEYRTNEQKLKDKMKELEKTRKEQEEKFRREMAELKEQQAKELKELREKSEEDIRKVRVEGEENLRKTKNEMEDTHRREMANHDQKNEQKIQGLKSNYEQEAKSIKDAAAQQVQNLQSEMQRDRSKIDSLEKKLSEKSSSSTTDMINLITKMEESSRLREERAEDRRMKFEEKRLEAEDKRQKAEDKREEQRRQDEIKRQEIERKKAKMQAAWKKWEEDKKSFLEEQDRRFWGREKNWREKMPKPPSDDYNDYK